MSEVGKESGLNSIGGLPRTIYAINEVLREIQTVREALKAHTAGQTDDLRSGGGCHTHTFLSRNIYAPEGILTPKLSQEGANLQKSWSRLGNNLLVKMTNEIDGLVPKGANPVRHLDAMFASEDPNQSRLAFQFYEDVGIARIRHPKALGILTRQATYEKKVLATLAPHHEDISPTEANDNFKLKREPADITQAIDIIREVKRFSSEHAEGFTNSDRGLSLHLQDDLPGLLKQDGFFASLVPVGLLEKWRIIQDELEQPIAKDLSDFDKYFAYNFPSMLPGAGTYYRRRLDYEAQLIQALEAQKNGETIPAPTNLTQVRELVEITRGWTEVTAKTFRERREFGWRGGFNYFYNWIGREDASGYLPTELTEEGKQLRKSWEALKKDCARLAIRRTWGIDLDSLDPDKTLEEIDKAKENTGIFADTNYVRTRAAYLLMTDQRSLSHLESQANFERSLLGYLLFKSN